MSEAREEIIEKNKELIMDLFHQHHDDLFDMRNFHEATKRALNEIALAHNRFSIEQNVIELIPILKF